MIKKLILGVIACAVLFWSYRIYSVNQGTETNNRIKMGEVLEGDTIDLLPCEAYLFSKDEFLDFFSLSEDELVVDEEDDCRIVCVCLLASNQTDKDVSWDDVMEKTEGGFETTTWGSLGPPYLSRNINVFYDECLRAGKSQKIWRATAVNTVCFKKTTWEQMKLSDFSYVLPSSSGKLSVDLSDEKTETSLRLRRDNRAFVSVERGVKEA